MKNLTKVAVAVAALTASAAGFAGGTDNYAQPAAPQDAFYVGLHGGANIAKGGPKEAVTKEYANSPYIPNLPDTLGDYLSTGIGLGLNVGYKFAFAQNQAARVEFEYTYLINKFKGKLKDSGLDGLKQNLFMLNGIYDYSPVKEMTLSVGAGLGFAYLGSSGERTLTSPDDGSSISITAKSETRFAMQLIAGASYNVMDNLSLGVTYKFTPVLGVKFDGEARTNSSNYKDFTNNSGKALYNNQIELALNYFIPA